MANLGPGVLDGPSPPKQKPATSGVPRGCHGGGPAAAGPGLSAGAAPGAVLRGGAPGGGELPVGLKGVHIYIYIWPWVA